MRRPIVSALVIAVAQGAIVASLAVQAANDHERLPRAWVLTRPEGAANAVHGRYLRLPIVPVADPGLAPRQDVINGRAVVRPTPVALEARDGRLLAHKAPTSYVWLVRLGDRPEAEPVLSPSIDYYVPPAAGDPSQYLKHQELWLEVSVGPRGAPRPLRLGIKQGERVVPIRF